MDQFVNFYKPNEKKNFWLPDSIRSFRKNQKRLGKDWKYRDIEILYTTNEFGFRTKSHFDIDWKESIVILGCSNVFGIGLENRKTLAKQLEKLVGVDVINLGIPGSALDLAVFNSFFIYENLPHPKAIIQVWTSPERYSQFYLNGDIETMAPFTKGFDPKLNSAFKNLIHIEQDRALWRNSSSVYREYSFFDDWLYLEKDFGIKKDLGIEIFDELDKARDLSHPGDLTNLKAAEIVKKDLDKVL